jgi:rubrerythrin
MSPLIKRRHDRCINEIDLSLIEKDLIAKDYFIFTILACASFIEISADTYSSKFVKTFSWERDIAHWLENDWKIEEEQHGHILRAYIERVWPGFEWEKAYSDFITQYQKICASRKLEDSPELEMMSRCVVETSTATFYSAVLKYIREPVLRQVVLEIVRDEVAHYNNFYRILKKYNNPNRLDALTALGVIWRRTLKNRDIRTAFEHVRNRQIKSCPQLKKSWNSFRKELICFVRDYYPYAMAFKMLIKPLPGYEPLKFATKRILLAAAKWRQ